MLVVEDGPVGGGMQPWNGVLFPSAASDWRGDTLTAAVARSVPAIGRWLGLVPGQAMQMPLQAVQGDVPLPQTPLSLVSPDPEHSLPWIVGQTISDWLIHGNAISLVTSRDSTTGLPRTWSWVPAQTVGVRKDTGGPTRYYVGGVEVPTRDVMHVQRGAQEGAPYVGIGIVEEFSRTVRRAVAQEVYEADVLTGAAVPSVAVISPNADPSERETELATQAWADRYGGPRRRPGIFPKGTTVTPLSWSPADSELSEARKMSLTDAANFLNIDGYWLGATSPGYSYKSPGPMYLNLIRQTVGPILVQIEAAWSSTLLPAGVAARFERFAAMRDDMGTTVQWVRAGIEANILTLEEGRGFLGLTGQAPADLVARHSPGSRAAAEVAQKVYLAFTAGVLTVEEARQMIEDAGATLGDTPPAPTKTEE